tara:strand:- start:314 stop:697 length:384 start_codon:yes stop_codon:yes gene_type:complete
MEAAIAIIFNEDDEVLLLKRVSPQISYPGLWGFPGGKRDGDESFEDCAIRETKEEANLEVTNLKYVGTEPRPIGSFGFVWVYTSRSFYGDVKLDFEHTDYEWVTRENLSNYNIIPGSEELIERARHL